MVFEFRLKVQFSSEIVLIRKLPFILLQKIVIELYAQRVIGPFYEPPFSECLVSPLGLVPKKEKGEFRVIHHLSFPAGASVHNGISQRHKSVHYQNIDCAVQLIKYFGRGSLLGKTDILHAFISLQNAFHEVPGYVYRIEK